MSYIGIAPPPYEESLGSLRTLLGDTDFTELDPPVAGKGVYELFSDDVLQSFLTFTGDSVIGAAYYAYLQLSGKAAKDSKMVKDFDLQVDLTKKSADYARLASAIKDQWDEDRGEVFEVVFPPQGSPRVGEASPFPMDRGYIG